RLKDLVIVAGRSYSPSDIERAAEQVEGVRVGRSVAFGVPDPDLGTEVLVVLAEVQPRAPEELVTLGESVRATVADHSGLSPEHARGVLRHRGRPRRDVTQQSPVHDGKTEEDVREEVRLRGMRQLAVVERPDAFLRQGDGDVRGDRLRDARPHPPSKSRGKAIAEVEQRGARGAEVDGARERSEKALADEPLPRAGHDRL